MGNVKCRLLYLVGQLHTGGLERQLYYLLRTMDRQRYKPAVAVWSYSDKHVHVPLIQALGLPLYSFPRTFSRIAKLGAFRNLVKQLEPEVVHSYSFYTNFAAYWGTRGAHATAFGSVRNDFVFDKKSAGLWLGSVSARWPNDQICNSYSAAKNIHETLGPFIPRRPYVVRNGLDLERFKSSPLAMNGTAHISGVGYLLPAKRWDRLLTATRELRRRGFDCLLEIAGEGPMRESLEQQAQGLGVADRVKFPGHVDDITKLLANTLFLAHTADSEGCPNAVMEAMACGRAVVAMDAGDIPSLVEDGKTGFVVRRGDIETLVERMVTLITDSDLRRRMGEAARAKAEREFGLNRLVEETLAAYRAAGWRDG